MKEFEESGKNKEEIDKINSDVEKLQEILIKLDDKNKKRNQPDLERDKK